MLPVALKWGALVGVATYLVVGVGVTLLGLLAFGNGPADLNTDPGKLALGCTSIFLLLFAFSAAGYFAGRETGRVGVGTLAGVIAAVIYGLLLFFYTPGAGFGGAPTTGGGAQLGVVAEVAVQIVTIALYAAVAAVMGLLGARPGAQRSPRRRIVSEQAAGAQP